jgi:hypothetical protein
MTTSKVSRLSPKAKERIRKGLLRSWQPGGTHRTKQESRPIDADTLRSRALDDRRGKQLCLLNTRPYGETYTFLWSTTGRTDQVDVFQNGRLLFTAAPKKAFAQLIGL